MMTTNKNNDFVAEEAVKDSSLNSSKNTPYPKEESLEDEKENTSLKDKKSILGFVFIFALLALSIAQSIELISLKEQIQKGQFGTGAPAASDTQGLPAQQGGC